jgi:hypothetical protein
MVRKFGKGRRRFIQGASAVIVAGIAGCTGDRGDGSGGGGGDFGGDDEPQDSDGDGVPDNEDDFPNDSTRSELLSRGSESYDLNEDYYQYLQFSPSQPATLSYDAEVRGDIRIDVILTDETNFRYFEDGTDWEYYGEGSELDTLRASNEMEIGTDRNYYLIIDNTDEGRAAPPTNFDNDRVEADVEYEVYA